jgi:hypothetical protein
MIAGTGRAQARLVTSATAQQPPTAGPIRSSVRAARRAGCVRMNSAAISSGSPNSATAFYVDNGPHLPLWDKLPALSFWFLPSAVAAPIITRALLRARKNARTTAVRDRGW